MPSPVTVSASQFRSNFFKLYEQHLSKEAVDKRPVKIVNRKTSKTMLNIQPLGSEKVNPALKKYVQDLKKGKFRISNYDVESYQRLKKEELKKTKKILAGNYE